MPLLREPYSLVNKAKVSLEMPMILVFIFYSNLSEISLSFSLPTSHTP